MYVLPYITNKVESVNKASLLIERNIAAIVVKPPSYVTFKSWSYLTESKNLVNKLDFINKLDI